MHFYECCHYGENEKCFFTIIHLQVTKVGQGGIGPAMPTALFHCATETTIVNMNNSLFDIIWSESYCKLPACEKDFYALVMEFGAI